MDIDPPNTNDQLEQTKDASFLEFENFSKFFETFSTSVKQTIQTSNQLFANQSDYENYLAYPDFKKFMQSQNDRILKLIGTMLKHQNVKKSNYISGKIDDDERLDIIIDANDQIIERLGIQLDEIEGLRKKTETELKLDTLFPTTRNINTSWNKNTGMTMNKNAANSLLLNYNNKRVIQKSQKLFEDQIDNSYLPFTPKLRQKPNAIKPIAHIFSILDTVEKNEQLFEIYPELLENPYTFELDSLTIHMDYLTKSKQPQMPIDFETCPYEYIEREEQLLSLIVDINQLECKEIAVDLEHHSYRSYLGFTCLMQISTRSKDYLVDTIKLRAKMPMLNDIFTNKNILKIFHGSDSDIDWLQKDFGIYVVNMFDTGQAARLLQYPHYSLSYLLQKFCQIQAQKQYQMSDWRQRPLDEQQVKYARQDTHYLLYIFDMMHNELLTRGQLQACYDNSKQICKKTYKKPLFYSKSYLNLCSNNIHLNNRQLCALKLLYEWRDRIARDNDESCEYVLKTHQLIKISELLPREVYGILALCNPISHLVEGNLYQIHEIVKQARDLKTATATTTTATETVDNSEQKQSEISYRQAPEFDVNSIINCPHDLSHSITNENQEQVGNQSEANECFILIKPEAVSKGLVKSKSKSILFQPAYTKNKNQKKVSRIFESLENPFELYLPNELRTATPSSSAKWVLLKSNADTFYQINGVKNAAEGDLSQPKVEDINDTNVIPLKLQLKNESVGTSFQKKKKTTVDYTDAIIKYNEMKNVTEPVLGSASGSDLIQSAINSNLVKIAANIQPKQPQQQDFQYENAKFNDLFNKTKKFISNANANVFDPNGQNNSKNNKKSHNNPTGRVQKRSNPNSNRNRNKNATFKQD